MANIYLRGLYDQKAREFNVLGAGLTRFEQDFVVAVNRAINRINRLADLDTRITRVSDLDDYAELDEKYEDVLSSGVTVELHKMGSRPAKGAEAMVSLALQEFKDGIDSMAFDLINARQDADADDETIGIDGIY